MKRLTRIISIMLIVALTFVFVSAPTVEAKSKKPSITDFYIYDYGAYMSVRVKNKTKKTITVSQKAKFYGPMYEYLGEENPNDLDEDEVDNYLADDYEWHTITFKPKKTVKIKPKKSKWVKYKKVSSGYYAFEDECYVKITVGYKQGKKKKTCSGWFEFELDY